MSEGQHLEWKASWWDDYLKSVCTFASADGGVPGIVQRCGVGIGMARYALRRYERRDPEPEVPPNHMRCAIRARESITPGHAEAE